MILQGLASEYYDIRVFFKEKSFYWKLGYNPSLLILWMTCWGFGFKSYDVS